MVKPTATTGLQSVDDTEMTTAIDNWECDDFECDDSSLPDWAQPLGACFLLPAILRCEKSAPSPLPPLLFTAPRESSPGGSPGGPPPQEDPPEDPPEDPSDQVFTEP